MKVLLKVCAVCVAMILSVPAAKAQAAETQAGFAKFVALMNDGTTESVGLTFKPAKCSDMKGMDKAFESCFLEEIHACFFVQTQAEDRDPTIFAFDGTLKPGCPADMLTKAEKAFLQTYLTCDSGEAAAKASAEFLAQPVEFSTTGATEAYEDYVNTHQAYPGYQLKDACRGMTGVNIHDTFKNAPHVGMALYVIEPGSSSFKPKAN